MKNQNVQLNIAQQKAVDMTEGPVMVIAGPGTGKTQILSARIAKIIEEGRAEPNEILCLTFTEAGAIAMRNRLLSNIGTTAYKVNIHTFHSFCNKVIQENLSLFGTGDLDLISELEEIELIHQLIDGFSIDHPLRRNSSSFYYERKNLKPFFDNIKKEKMDVPSIIQYCKDDLEEALSSDEFVYKRASGNNKKGDLNQKKFDEFKQKVEQTIAAAEAYPSYLELLEKSNRYTYDDMILWVIEKFKTNEDLLFHYQEQMQYILVDEYQDTNGSQNEIVNLLSSHWGVDANLFVVGDDDQSIYRFQGANIANIFSFYNQYIEHLSPEEQEERVIVLTENYRSSQSILNASMSLIEINEERLTNEISGIHLSKKLVAKGENRDLNDWPVIEEYKTQYDEIIGIANQIEALIKEGVEPKDIAVLYRSHQQSEGIIRYLTNINIPIKTVRKNDVFDSVLMNHVFKIFQFLTGEKKYAFSQEDKIFDLLYAPFFNIPPIVMSELAYAYRVAKKQDYHLQLRTFLLSVRDEKLTPAIEMYQLLERWLSDIESCTLQQIVEKVLTEGGVIAWAMNQPTKVYILQELNTFFEFVKAETSKKPKMNLNELLELIDLMISVNLGLPFMRVHYQEKAVNFISVHSSKGLEFDYVFVIGNEKKSWEKAQKKSGYYIPPKAYLSKKEEGKHHEDDLQEERRLLYVAMTRAKKQLKLSYSISDINDKTLAYSQFIAELKLNQQTIVSNPLVDEEKVTTYLSVVLQELKKENPAQLEKAYIEHILEHYRLSVTHLDGYLKCPLTFYFNSLLRIPRAKNDSFAFGNAIHQSLEFVFKEMKKNDGVFPQEQTLLRTFEFFMGNFQECFTSKQFEQRLQDGKKILPDFYNNYKEQWNKNVVLEESFNAVVKDVPIVGKMDKIEINGSSAIVVDYKTGKITNVKKYRSDARPLRKEELENIEAPEHYEKHGGDYWRQAVFYKILIDQDPRNWSANRVVFDFVERDKETKKFKQIDIVVTPEDEDIVMNQITETYANIKDMKFDGCGKDDCEWCCFMNGVRKKQVKW